MKIKSICNFYDNVCPRCNAINDMGCWCDDPSSDWYNKS